MMEDQGMNWYSKLVKENVYGVGVQISMLIGGMFSAILFPRILGAEQFGYFSLVFAFVNFWLFFSNFGIDQSVVRFVSLSQVKKNTESYIKFFSRWKYLLTILSSVLLFVLSDFIAGYVFRDVRLGVGIKIGCLYVLFYSLYTYYGSVFVGLKNNKLVFVSTAAYQLLRVIIPIALVTILIDYTNVILGISISAVIALAILVHKLRRERLLNETETMDMDSVRKFIFYGSLGYFGTLLIQWMGPMILGVFKTPVEVGFYRIGLMWISSIGLLIPFSNKILFSFYSEDHEANRKREMESVFRHSIRYSIIFSFLAIVGIALTSYHFIDFVYGQEYIASYTILIILSFLSLEISLNSANFPLLLGMGRIDVVTKYNLAVGILSSIFSAIVVQSYGMNGVAMVIMLTRLVSIILLTNYVRNLMKTTIEPSYYLKPGFCALATFLTLYSLRGSITSVITGFIFCAIIVSIYSILLFLTKSITSEEIKKIASAISQR